MWKFIKQINIIDFSTDTVESWEEYQKDFAKATSYGGTAEMVDSNSSWWSKIAW